MTVLVRLVLGRFSRPIEVPRELIKLTSAPCPKSKGGGGSGHGTSDWTGEEGALRIIVIVLQGRVRSRERERKRGRSLFRTEELLVGRFEGTVVRGGTLEDTGRLDHRARTALPRAGRTNCQARTA